MQLSEKRVFVTGGSGFLGSFVMNRLRERGCKYLFAPRSSEFDLREKEAIVQVFEQFQPEVVLHLAAVVGGIEANRLNPGKFFYDNAIMGIQLMEYARQFGVEKFVTIGTICAYPKFTPVPFKEDDLWEGYPEETNAPYGLAKKMMLVQAQAYREQYGFNAVYLLPVNLYGPRDNFDLVSSHVIPAMIRKFVEATEREAPFVTLWGDGSPTREFLYVDDAAEGIVLAAEHYDDSEPVNLGSGQEIRIDALAELVKELVGYRGEIVWDSDKPNGQPRRCLDTSRAANAFGFRAKTSFMEGLRDTIAWYQSVREKTDVPLASATP